METPLITEDLKLGLMIGAIFVIALIAFWPLVNVFIWAVAVAVPLIPLQKRLSLRVRPQVSATVITVGVLLVIVLILSLGASLLLYNEQHISEMVLSMIYGLENTGLSGIFPTFTEIQLANFNETLRDFMVNTVVALTGNTLQTILSIIIFFLSLSMLLCYGEGIWYSVTWTLSDRIARAVQKMADISISTIYALLVVQISAALISFLLALPFFYLLGAGDIILFASLIGFAMLIPLIGAQIMIIFLAIYFFSIGDVRGAVIMLFIGYPLLSGWIDFYYRPVMMGKRVAVHPVIMMIGIFAGVPFMGIVGFILGPVLIALVVTGYSILAESAAEPNPVIPSG